MDNFCTFPFVNAKFGKVPGDSIPFQPFDLKPPVEKPDLIRVIAFKSDQFPADQSLFNCMLPLDRFVIGIEKNAPGIAHDQDEHRQDKKQAYDLK